MDRKGRNGGTLRSFEKGRSGNPTGRPSGQGMISQLMNELGQRSDLELTMRMTGPDGKVSHQQLSYAADGQNTLFAIIAIQIIYRALRGDIHAFKVLLDRTEGRVPPPIRLKPTDKPLVNEHQHKSAHQLRQEIVHLQRLQTEASMTSAPGRASTSAKPLITHGH